MKVLKMFKMKGKAIFLPLPSDMLNESLRHEWVQDTNSLFILRKRQYNVWID